VACCPDGKRIVAGSENETVKVWDAQTGKETLALKGHTHWVSSVAFSADGRRIASGSDDKTVRVWDAQTGQEQLTLQGHTDAVLSVAFSADGRRIVSASCGSAKNGRGSGRQRGGERGGGGGLKGEGRPDPGTSAATHDGRSAT